MKLEQVKDIIRDVYDFPTKGIVFKDLTTAFKDPAAMKVIGATLNERYKELGVTKVVGIESRGFIGASILAYELNAGFVPVRKPGKLPADTLKMSYSKEKADALATLTSQVREIVSLIEDVILLINKTKTPDYRYGKSDEELIKDSVNTRIGRIESLINTAKSQCKIIAIIARAN